MKIIYIRFGLPVKMDESIEQFGNLIQSGQILILSLWKYFFSETIHLCQRITKYALLDMTLSIQSWTISIFSVVGRGISSMNTIAYLSIWLECYFWTTNHEQTTMCERDAKARNRFLSNQLVSFILRKIILFIGWTNNWAKHKDGCTQVRGSDT